MPRNFLTFVGAVLMAAALLVSPVGAQGAEDDPAQVEAGMAVYEASCAGCHGADGMGSDRGRSLTDVAGEADRAVHFASVANGKTGMPPFGDNLSAEEIDAAISYVRLTFVSESAEPAAEEMEEMEELPATGAESLYLAMFGAVLLSLGLVLRRSATLR